MESLVKEGSIGSVLFNSRIITEEDINSALDEQRASGCRFGEALVKLGIVAQEDIDWALSNQLNIPYVRLNEKTVDASAVSLVPAELARRYNLIPIIRTGDELHIALADPMNLAAVEAVEKETGCRVTVSMPIIRELRDMLDLFYGPARGETSFGLSSNSFTPGILEKINEDMSGALLLKYLILFYLQNGLTALSLRPRGPLVAISARKGHTRRDIGAFPSASYQNLLLHIRGQAAIKASSEIASEGRIQFHYKGMTVMIAAFLIRLTEGEYVTFSMDRDDPFPSSLEKMGLGPAAKDDFQALASASGGMILCASGNRRARLALLDIFLEQGSAKEKNILLAGKGTGERTSFPRIPLPDGSPEDLEQVMAALPHHDADLIALADVTSGRIFLTAWRAALRGHMVAAGIDCDGLGKTLDYLMAARRDNPSIALGIAGIMTLTPVRTLCPSCREAVKAPASMPGLPDADRLYRAPGCLECGYTGLEGTRYLADVLPFGPDVRELFAHAGNGREMLRRLAEKGYHGAAEELEDLLLAGGISPEEYLAAKTQ
jgi:type II secretory ATPase GspE/PulE/Tfp pilus assembly ATPase PilB-like protein